MQEEETVKTEDIQEILFYLDPLIRSRGNHVQSESLLRSLQELDGGWGQYKMATTIKKKLQLYMGDMVSQEVKKASNGSDLTAEAMQDLAPIILQKLMAGPRWAELVEKVKYEVGSSSRQVAESIRKEGKLVERPPSRHVAASGPDSLGSTWNQANFIFMQPEQLRLLGRQITGAEGEEAKVQALNTLLLSQITDIVGGESWSILKTGLRKVLADQNSKVSDLGLKFHARLLVSGSHFAVKEGFQNLLETISSWYQDKRLSAMLPSCGMSDESHIHVACLNIFNLVFSMAADLPRMWIRFPHRYIEEMIETMVAFLSISSTTHYSPLSILGVVDTEAAWLKEWLHSNQSRAILLVKMGKYKSVLKVMSENVKKYLEQNTFEHFKEVQENLKSFNSLNQFNLIPGLVIDFGSFIQQMNFLSNLLSYKQGQTILPQKEELLVAMANFLCFPQVASGPGKVVSECLKRVLKHSIGLNTNILATLLPMLSVGNVDSSTTALCTINVLHILSDTSIMKDASTKLAPKLTGLLTSYGEDKHVKESILKLTMEAIKQDEFFLSTYWRNLFQKILEDPSTDRNIISGIVETPAGIFMAQKSIAEDMIVQYIDECPGLIGRSRKLSEVLMQENILYKEMDMMWKLLIGEDEFAQYWPNDDFIDQLAENHILHLMLMFSSFEFISSSGEQLSYLRSILGLADENSEYFDFSVWRENMLRILTISCTNLDCMFFLESNFHLSEVVERKFDDFIIDDEIVTDEEYLYWRYLKGLTTDLGGFSEKKTYKLSLGDVQEPRTVKSNTNVPSKQSLSLTNFLEEEDRILDIGWIDNTGALMRDILVLTNSNISKPQARSILEKVAIVHAKTHMESFETDNKDLHKNEYEIANKLVVEYGRRILVIDGNCDHRADLEEVMLVSQSLFPSPGYDWFAAALFLMTGGNTVITKNILSSLPATLVSPFLWRNHGTATQPSLFHLGSLGHCVEMILKEDVPALAATLHMAKVPASAITDLWIRQCFINILDFQEVTNFVLIALIFGVDYIVYFSVSLLCHLQEEILSREEDVNLYQKIMTLPVEKFMAGDYLAFMDMLAKKHRSKLLQYFTDILHDK